MAATTRSNKMTEENKNVETKAVETTETKAVATTAPAGLPQGLPEAPAGELIIPRAKLLQALSPEIVDGMEGLRPGMIISNITKEVLPAEFSPFFFFRCWTKFNPRKQDDPHFDKNLEPGAFVWSSFDENDPRVIEGEKFGANDEKPEVTKFLSFMGRFANYDMPVIVSFSSTSLRAGKQLLTQLRFGKPGEPIWAKRFKLTGRKETTKGFNYFVLDVVPAGKTPDDEMAICADWFQMYSLKAKEQDFSESDGEHKEASVRPY